MKLNLLKFIYRGLLTGMPICTYNPISKNNFVAPVEVLPYSTYINFKLNKNQVSILTEYIHKYNKNFSISPIKLLEKDAEKNYYLSVNIYNCTSAIMSNKDTITRCELNTYVKNKEGELGTMILDYTSNKISMDPISVFKKSELTKIKLKDGYINCRSFSDYDKIILNLRYQLDNNYESKELSKMLLEYTDKIFYKNGIYDKVYYDSSLTEAETLFPCKFDKYIFRYKDMVFTDVTSIFYFKENIKFVGSMWDNLYSLK